MTAEQGDLALLDDPVAQELLHSTNLARLAYTWRDGTPRVVPIWFHWDGEAIVLGSPPNAPKVNVLPDNSKVALTIDRDEFTYIIGMQFADLPAEAAASIEAFLGRSDAPAEGSDPTH